MFSLEQHLYNNTGRIENSRRPPDEVDCGETRSVHRALPAFKFAWWAAGDPRRRLANNVRNISQEVVVMVVAATVVVEAVMSAAVD